MNTKHTPGPWTINLSGKEPVIGYDCEDGGPLLPIAPIVSGRDEEMIHANARLIAAAPLGLAAAREALQDWQELGQVTPEAMEALRLFVVEATGNK